MRQLARISFLPGPVNISYKAKKALDQPPIYHRSVEFIEIYEEVRNLLGKLVNADYVQIMMGTGTLANDAVAAQLSLLNERGLIVNNGEFGARLVDHGRRFGLLFDVLTVRLNTQFVESRIAKILSTNQYKWLWVVHCESSTGTLLDLVKLKEMSSEFGVKLCLDCVSTVGTIPVDLQTVYLSTSTSGKGLGAFPGLSFVFHNHRILPTRNNIPRYLDLGYYESSEGSPFTFSSNLLLSLRAVLLDQKWEVHFRRVKELSNWIRNELTNMGFCLLTPEEVCSPAIITIVLPITMNSCHLGNRLVKLGFLLSYRSGYLIERNWIQIVLMGQYTKKKIQPLLNALEKYVQL